ncbi:MAG: hypothetical protein ACI9R3_004446 [Verrucomicrobiales bacterium]|jgi:hypothetical protein
MRNSKNSERTDAFFLSNGLIAMIVMLGLFGIGFAAMTSLVAKARIVTTHDQVKALETGLKNYLSAHPRSPLVVDGERAKQIDDRMTAILIGKNTNDNPLGIRYWESFKKSAPNSAEAPRDPFGRGYWVILDANRDRKIENPAREGTGNWLQSSALVFSAGPDGDPKTWQDNVRNWK